MHVSAPKETGEGDGARTRKEEHDGLERIKEQAERLSEYPAECHDEWNDKEGDLLCEACGTRGGET